MIRTLVRLKNGEIRLGLAAADLAEALSDDSGLVWVDFSGEPPEVCEPLLRGVFDFHPLAIDDALAETHVPKVDDWGNYLYVAIHAIRFDADAEHPLTTHELDAFLGKNYLVTHHDDPIAAVDRIWDRCQRDQRSIGAGADHLYYALADDVVLGYMETVEAIDETIEDFEDVVFERPTPDTLAQVFSLKRGLLQLRRIVSPQREVFNRLARDDFRVIDRKDRVYFRDVYDHLVRLHDINESMRDQVTGILEIYLSVINNRMNEIMKTLTVITTLFMPITFLTGFFGMNFFGPTAPFDTWTSWPAFGVTMAILVVTPAAFYFWVRRRAWI
ncbi:MAG: magnesium and cobalt transport protein CorA [Gammaproteobacteria bacterium RBG_16_66_13]|nr:MAG: magnesium and cobalt transport protein CorA [Gammaproteobacteria bacterium RBG_16_66_13]